MFWSNYRFEEALLAYVETIKGNGITDYFLWRQFNDDYYDNFRNTMSILNLEYRVDTERIRVIFNENIKDIILEKKNSKDYFVYKYDILSLNLKSVKECKKITLEECGFSACKKI